LITTNRALLDGPLAATSAGAVSFQMFYTSDVLSLVANGTRGFQPEL
jgi:hypothetical protein